jgi:biopolymer transport protein ExbB/TolQ
MENFSKKLGVAVGIVIAFAAILTFVLLYVIDLATFGWHEKEFESELRAAIVKESRSLGVENIDTISACFLYESVAKNQVALCPVVKEDNGKISIYIDVIDAEANTTFELARSKYSFIKGRTTYIGSQELQGQVFQLGSKINSFEDNEARDDDSKSGFRWMQSIIKVLKEGTRTNTRLVGWVQLLIYSFSMFAIALMVVDISFVKKNKEQLKRLSFLDKDTAPSETITTSEMREIYDLIEEGKQSFSFHPAFEPTIVYDSLEPSLDFLMTYTGGEVNRGELLQSINTICEGVENRLERRFQILRYFVMTIPSLGFIGTILGISEALGLTSRLTGNSPVYEKIFANESLGQSLNVAFDTTLVALITSIFLSFFIDWLEAWELNFTNIVRQKIVNRFSSIKTVVNI